MTITEINYLKIPEFEKFKRYTNQVVHMINFPHKPLCIFTPIYVQKTVAFLQLGKNKKKRAALVKVAIWFLL